jgi:hypothetical protein
MAFQGNWKIVSDVYFYKETTPLTYAQARWEMLGGWLPVASLRQFFSGQFYSFKYHLLTLIDLFRSIIRLKVSILNRVKLLLISSSRILGHYLMLLLHYKKRPVSNLGKSGDA